jgi:hypothetical protein
MLSKRDLTRQVLQEGAVATVGNLSRALKKKKLKFDDFSIRDLAESLVVNRDGKPVGRSWVEQLSPRKSGGYSLREAATGVSLSHFANITGQIMYSKVMAGYQQEEFIADQLVTTQTTEFSGEKVPGVGGLIDNVESIHEGMPYPQMGFGEDWVETPATIKRGVIIAVNKEAIFFDRTGLVLQRAGEVGELIARSRRRARRGQQLQVEGDVVQHVPDLGQLDQRRRIDHNHGLEFDRHRGTTLRRNDGAGHR